MFAVANPDSVDSAVLDKVVHLTVALGAEFELFHCADGSLVTQPQRPGSFEGEHEVGELIERRQQELEHRAQGLRRPGLQVRSSVAWDYPIHEGIVRQVLRHQPDLLIVQPSRHHGPWMLGYTDYKLIETCPCPLLLMKTTRPYVESCLIAAVDPMHEHDKPAALDDVILDAATVLSTALSGKLWLFHARAPWPQVKPSLSHQPAAVREDVEIVHSRSVEERVLQLAHRHGIARNNIELVEGHAVDALPFFARRESADIVAIGAVSRSLLKRIVIGHTAEVLLDGLDCDLLIMKPPGFRSRVHLPAEFPTPTTSAAHP
jgi:universal stress protein E